MRPMMLSLLVVAGSARAADPKDVLNNPITLGRIIDSAPLKDVLEFFEDKTALAIRIDEAAFKKNGATGIPDKEIRLPKVEGVPLAFVLEAAAHQVGGTLRVDKDGVTIVPGKRDPADVLGPASEKLKKKLAEKIEIERKSVGVPFEDLIDSLEDKSGVTVVTGDWLFPPTPPAKAGGKSEDKATAMTRRRHRLRSPLAEMQCGLDVGTQPLQTWLEKLAKQVDCKVVPAGDVVLIVPLPKEKK